MNTAKTIDLTRLCTQINNTVVLTSLTYKEVQENFQNMSTVRKYARFME